MKEENLNLDYYDLRAIIISVADLRSSSAPHGMCVAKLRSRGFVFVDLCKSVCAYDALFPPTVIQNNSIIVIYHKSK